MSGLIIIVVYVILTIIVGFSEYRYLSTQNKYWDSIPIGDLEFYENPYETKFSFKVLLFPLSIVVVLMIVLVKGDF